MDNSGLSKELMRLRDERDNAIQRANRLDLELATAKRELERAIEAAAPKKPCDDPGCKRPHWHGLCSDWFD